jgi:hypothetical protein
MEARSHPIGLLLMLAELCAKKHIFDVLGRMLAQDMTDLVEQIAFLAICRLTCIMKNAAKFSARDGCAGEATLRMHQSLGMFPRKSGELCGAPDGYIKVTS